MTTSLAPWSWWYTGSTGQNILLVRSSLPWPRAKHSGRCIFLYTGTTGLNNLQIRSSLPWPRTEHRGHSPLQGRGLKRVRQYIRGALPGMFWFAGGGGGFNPFFSITLSKPLMFLGSWLTLYNFEIYYLSAVNYDPAATYLSFIIVKI